MLTRIQLDKRNQLEALSLEDLVPKDYLICKLNAAIVYHFIYPLIEH